MKQKSTFVAAWLAAAFLTPLGAFAQDWELVWSDEFDGPNIDLTKWAHEVNGGGGGNNELQYYTARATNSFIENGNLVIQALEEDYTGPDGTRDYTSARLRTLNQGDWKYGRFEIRARTPTGQGLWPAIWMLPTDWVYGGWAASGEIDIMELLGQQDNKTHGTLHYGGAWPNNTSSGGSYFAPSGNFAATFHTFALEWEANEFRWYVDGVHYHTETSWYSTEAAYPAPFNQRFHMLLNVAVGGNWPGSPDASTVFPQRMEVDYVRVYQRSTDPGPPTPIPGSGTTRIEAEDYSTGGEGNGYHDLSPGNTGNQYRTDDVDIEVTGDAGGGFNVGWLEAGEWLLYPVDVEAPGLYTLRFRAASPGGGSFRLYQGATDLTGPMTAPPTGGWQNWTSVIRTNVLLFAGEQSLRFYVAATEFNLNWIELVPPAPDQDADGDGMYDSFELQYDGNPTNFSPTVDSDSDGASNLDEFVADTNPTNSASRLILTGITSGPPMTFSVWPASTARVYSLQANTNALNPLTWDDVVDGLTPTGAVLSITDTNVPPPGATYRIGVTLPP